MVLLLSFWGARNPTPSVASVKLPIVHVVDVQIIMIKHVYGLIGCYREGPVVLVRPEFLLGVGGAQVKINAIPASMYMSQIWSIPCLKQGKEMDSPVQKWLLTVLKRILGVRDTTPSWCIMQECGL